MRYQAIEGKIWFDDRFCSLTRNQKLMFLYLLTCPHGNFLGIFVLKPAYGQSDLDYKTKDEYLKDLDGVCKSGMVLFDKESGVLWVKNLVNYGAKSGWNVKHKKGAEKTLKELPSNTLLKQFTDYYSDLLIGVSIPVYIPLPIPLRITEPEPEPEPEPGNVGTLEGIRLASFLFECIKKRNNGHKPPNLKKWAVHVDRMIRLDKREPGEIEKVIEWCQADIAFWANNILSTEKLREHYDQLKLKMNTPAKEKKPDLPKLKCHKEWVPPI